MHQLKELLIWRKSRILYSEIYSATSNFPTEEKFGLTNQLRRASVSIPLNISDGSSRHSNKDFFRFLEIAIGSAFEVETQLLIAFDLGFITSENTMKINILLQEIIKMTSKFRPNLV